MPDPVTPEPTRPDAPPGELDAAVVRRTWGDVVGLVNRSNKRIAALMRDAVVRELDGDILVLTVKSPVLAKMMSDDAAVLTEALYEVLGGRWQIHCEVAGDQRAAPPRPTPSASPRSAPSAPPRPVPGAASPGRTGGGAAGSVPASRSAGDADWPETARPGGSTAAAGADGDRPTSADPDTPARQGGGTVRSPAVERAGGAGTGAAPARVAGGGLAAARAAAAGRTQHAVATAGPEWAGEPPYDPEYDGPAGGAVSYEGFDPGDEPLDEVVDEQTARRTSEQQAVHLLQQALGAEKIGEVDLK